MDANKTSIIGLLGNHIENSFSPMIHQNFIRYYSLNYCYHCFQIAEDHLKDALQGIKILGIQGMNITFPFKERSIEFLDRIDSSAQKIGAINTVVRHDNQLYGYNTDWIGFELPLMEHSKISLANKKAVVLGAGGSAKAVVFVLGEAGCSKISIFNRTQHHAEVIKRNFEERFAHCKIKVFPNVSMYLQKEINNAELLINTTPLGSWYYPDQNPLPEDITLPARLLVYDLIYYPDKTPLLIKAEMNGNQVINGKEMLVYQAAESFYLWTGIRPEREIIIHILNKINKRS